MPKRQSDSNMDDPREFAAWAFAAGVPDPRAAGKSYQTLIPAACFPWLSQMLWDFGFRHHADLQTKWVPEYPGCDRNFVPLGLTDEAPSKDDLIRQATEMVVDQFPQVADRLRQMNPENRDQVVREQAEELLRSIERLKAATAGLDKSWGGDGT